MSEGLPIFGKEVFDTLFIDYRIIGTFAIISIIMFLAGMYLQLAKWGQGIPEGATKPLGAWGTLKLIFTRIFYRYICGSENPKSHFFFNVNYWNNYSDS